MQYQVLNVQRFNFTGDDGRPISTLKVTFLSDRIDSENSKGHEVMSFSGDVALWDRFKIVPGQYVFDLDLRSGKGGKATVRLRDAEYVPATK